MSYEDEMLYRERKLAKERRERIATAAFIGLIASPATDDDDWQEIAEKAVRATDALLAALDE